MKKLIILCLVMSMLLGILAGCAEGQEISDTVASLEKETQSTTPPTVKETEAAATEQTQPTTEAATEETQASAPETLISFGYWEGGVYTNGYAGFGCTLNENWLVYSAEELQELPEDVSDLYADTELGEISSKYSNVYDMMAENTEELVTMNVVYTKIGFQERLAYAVLSQEALLETVLANQDMMIEAYQQAGMEDIKMEKVKVTFLEEEHFAVKTSCMFQGVNYYILQVFDYSRGSYGITLTVSSFIQDRTEELLSMFYTV